MKKTSDSKSEDMITTTCSYDCGGRCLLKVHVRNGSITRISTENSDGLYIKACPRGLAQEDMVYSPDRLMQPIRRVGERGGGRFEKISWNDALQYATDEICRIVSDYSTESIYFVSGAGSIGALHNNDKTAGRFFGLLGKCTTTWGGVSFEGALQSSLATFGTIFTGNARDNLLHSRLIILWGWNPAVTRYGAETNAYLSKAKKAGIKIICVDPRQSQSCRNLKGEWIPIKPGTDTAMLIAMAYVIITEKLYNYGFVIKHTYGFNKFFDYVTGKEDGVIKNPRWAQDICGVPGEQIIRIARNYAQAKPAALITGWAPGRSAYGEQFHRAASVLAAITGNIGIKGGYASGGLNFVNFGMMKEKLPIPPTVHNKVHITELYNAIIHGKSKGYPSDCKLLYITGCNLLNQYLNLNKGKKAILKPECVIIHDLFITPTARYADLILPVSHYFERNDIGLPYTGGPYSIFMNKVLDAPSGIKSDLDIFSEIALRLGIKNYNNKTDKEWFEDFLQPEPEFPELDTLKSKSVYRFTLEQPEIAFRKQIEEPDSNPFPTPSGKIEIYSNIFAEMNNPLIPPIPKYIEFWEGPRDQLAHDYPIQLISTHSRARVNSQFDNIASLKKSGDDNLWINPLDADKRGIKDGEMVIVFNRRGKICVRAKVTKSITGGVASIDQGQWYRPDNQGLDLGGCANVLTIDKKSPAGAFPSNTCLVQIKKAYG